MDELARENEALRRQIAALEAEARRFRATLYSIGDAVITTDVRGTVVQMNPVAETLTGWSEHEAKGRASAKPPTLAAGR
ncbi:MAG: PAS domain S-box protein [Polyangiaceae bacterium]|nr:PAS domain S-box protein [Polyangiaceae bacterium]